MKYSNDGKGVVEANELRYMVYIICTLAFEYNSAVQQGLRRFVCVCNINIEQCT